MPFVIAAFPGNFPEEYKHAGAIDLRCLGVFAHPEKAVFPRFTLDFSEATFFDTREEASSVFRSSMILDLAFWVMDGQRALIEDLAARQDTPDDTVVSRAQLVLGVYEVPSTHVRGVARHFPAVDSDEVTVTVSCL